MLNYLNTSLIFSPSHIGKAPKNAGEEYSNDQGRCDGLFAPQHTMHTKKQNSRRKHTSSTFLRLSSGTFTYV